MPPWNSLRGYPDLPEFALWYRAFISPCVCTALSDSQLFEFLRIYGRHALRAYPSYSCSRGPGYIICADTNSIYRSQPCQAPTPCLNHTHLTPIARWVSTFKLSSFLPLTDLPPGAMLIGVLFSYVLFGVTTTQVYIYSNRFPNDSRKIKLLVRLEIPIGIIDLTLCSRSLSCGKSSRRLFLAEF